MKRIAVVLVLCLFLCGCTGDTQADKTFFAMDTFMQLQVWGVDAEHTVEAAEELICNLEKEWSVTDDDSFLSKLNRGLRIGLSPEQQEVLDKARQLQMRTGGVFDPQLYDVMLLWGFYDDNHRVPEKAALQQALMEERWDLGGVIKGYAGQLAANLLLESNIDRAILNLGGNIQTVGQKPDGSPWQIGIQNPAGEGQVGIVSVEGTASIVTSGSYQRYFEEDGVRYHHIIDPKTGYPAQAGLSSVTVICRDGMTADALSTALFVMGLEQGTQFWQESDDFEAVFILTDGRIFATEGANLSGCEFEVIQREK